MKNRKSKIENHCHRHASRIGVVDRGGAYLCWQCYLGDEKFLARFGPAFYPDFKARRVGHAHADNSTTKNHEGAH